MKKILVRFMKLSDLKQTKELNEKTLPENYPLHFWAEMFEKGKSHSIVAVYGGEIIGYVFCSEDQILSFAVHELYRKKGIGMFLMLCCLDTFTKPCSLNVRVGNVPALRLYKSLGFVIEKEEIGYYGNVNPAYGPIKPVENAYKMVYTPIALSSAKPKPVERILPQKLKIK